MAMQLTLSDREAKDLDAALARYLLELDRDLVRTDVHALQHEMRLTSERLDGVRDRLGRMIRSETEALQPSV